MATTVLAEADLKAFLELALDRVLEDFDMSRNFYVDYGLDSMGAVAFFVELQRRTGVEVPLELAPHLQTGAAITEYFQTATLPR